AGEQPERVEALRIHVRSDAAAAHPVAQKPLERADDPDALRPGETSLGVGAEEEPATVVVVGRQRGKHLADDPPDGGVAGVGNHRIAPPVARHYHRVGRAEVDAEPRHHYPPLTATAALQSTSPRPFRKP